jgi:hypothetical protein
MVRDESPEPNLSLQGVIEQLEEEGYRGSFLARPGGRLECLRCRRAFDAGEAELRKEFRIDVDTDPEDQSLVAALSCPACGALGTASFQYGPASSRDEAAVMARLHAA